jgi:hypothetical protein
MDDRHDTGHEVHFLQPCDSSIVGPVPGREERQIVREQMDTLVAFELQSFLNLIEILEIEKSTFQTKKGEA